MLNEKSNALGKSAEDSLTLQYVRYLRVYSISFCVVLLENIFCGMDCKRG